METLYKQLKQLMRTCPLEGRLAKFIPADELDKITLAHIQAGLPTRRRFFSSCISDKVAAEAKRIFCVLVLMEESAAMEQLINEGITDEDLPLCRNGDDSDDSEYNVLASVSGNKRFPSSMSWGEGDKVDNFLKKQWVVQAPILDKPGLHFVLEPECALPLTECETELAQGGMGVVHKAKLHPAHQHLFPADAEAYVAIKEFHKKEDFTREKNNLDIIQRLQNGHLIPLLASCERGSSYYLLFPWANGGTLRDFWGEHDCKPRTTGLIRWALEQILGLVDGIRALHNHNIRHGDIKPQNILVFEEHQGANLATLVLADMGVSKFHKEATDLRNSATMTAESTVSYEAPEADDDQRNNRPRPRRYDMWSAGCMFLEFTVWLVYDFAAVNGFHKKRKDQNDPVSPGNFFSREPGQSTGIHPAVTEAVRHLREHPLCKHGTALGDLVTVINDRLLQIKPGDRAKAPELYDRVKAIVDAAAAKPEYLGQEVKPPLPTPGFFSPPGSRKGSSS
ncbi:Protein kinase domain-containing protein [Fusarium falciforme]|uniref:Protein kinase domain-containing protein n=1 Tax=Fusarium falciforme TaxID=195108 RepID=UPI002300CFC1|nr:Protein kinase domain-containing protein [Fusarium falciforme]WAO91723.1 Protein kinase domain-containing protein [Fusarium falciforme]